MASTVAVSSIIESRKSPISRPARLFACIIRGGLNINKAQCQERCEVPSRNEEVCASSKCGSPWRLCIQCLLQGHKGEDAVVVDSEKGLCSFHKKNGREAKREKVDGGDGAGLLRLVDDQDEVSIEPPTFIAISPSPLSVGTLRKNNRSVVGRYSDQEKAAILEFGRTPRDKRVSWEEHTSIHNERFGTKRTTQGLQVALSTLRKIRKNSQEGKEGPPVSVSNPKKNDRNSLGDRFRRVSTEFKTIFKEMSDKIKKAEEELEILKGEERIAEQVRHGIQGAMKAFNTK